jgi:hypothetical protein
MTDDYIIHYKISVHDKHYEGNFVTSCKGELTGEAFLHKIKQHAARGHQGKDSNVIICGVFKL